MDNVVVRYENSAPFRMYSGVLFLNASAETLINNQNRFLVIRILTKDKYIWKSAENFYIV